MWRTTVCNDQRQTNFSVQWWSLIIAQITNDTFIYSGKPKNKKLTDFGDTLFFFFLLF